MSRKLALSSARRSPSFLRILSTLSQPCACVVVVCESRVRGNEKVGTWEPGGVLIHGVMVWTSTKHDYLNPVQASANTVQPVHASIGTQAPCQLSNQRHAVMLAGSAL